MKFNLPIGITNSSLWNANKVNIDVFMMHIMPYFYLYEISDREVDKKSILGCFSHVIILFSLLSQKFAFSRNISRSYIFHVGENNDCHVEPASPSKKSGTITQSYKIYVEILLRIFAYLIITIFRKYINMDLM